MVPDGSAASLRVLQVLAQLGDLAVLLLLHHPQTITTFVATASQIIQRTDIRGWGIRAIYKQSVYWKQPVWNKTSLIMEISRIMEITLIGRSTYSALEQFLCDKNNPLG